MTPGDTICVEQSILKWDGLGGHGIPVGLPMYVAIDRKPENGCEIQNAACGRSTIMLRLHLVTTAADQHGNLSAAETQLLHGTTVLQRLVGLWAGTDRIVCADSYFASVEAALSLKASGLRFIGVAKTAHRRLPMAPLAALQLSARGDWVLMVHPSPSGPPELMAVLWADRDRRYFVASAGSSRAGAPCERLRWRQLDGGAERVAVSVTQPEVAEIYYSCCAQIDRHNRCRQDDLRLERRLGTHDWSQRGNLSFLGVCIVDAWMLHSGARGPAASLEQATFYEDLASGLIDNTFDSTGWRPRTAQAATEATVAPAYGVGVHLTPSTKRRAPPSGGGAAFWRSAAVACAGRIAAHSSALGVAIRAWVVRHYCAGRRRVATASGLFCMLHTTPFCDNVRVGLLGGRWIWGDLDCACHAMNKVPCMYHCIQICSVVSRTHRKRRQRQLSVNSWLLLKCKAGGVARNGAKKQSFAWWFLDGSFAGSIQRSLSTHQDRTGHIGHLGESAVKPRCAVGTAYSHVSYDGRLKSVIRTWHQLSVTLASNDAND